MAPPSFAKRHSPDKPSIPLGRATLLTKDVTYTVADTGVEVTLRSARMVTTAPTDNPSRERHTLTLTLEVTRHGKNEPLEVDEPEPRVIHGLQFRADPAGFEWNKGSACVVVERASP